MSPEETRTKTVPREELLLCPVAKLSWMIPENLEAGDTVPPQRGHFTIPVHYAHRYIRSHKHVHPDS